MNQIPIQIFLWPSLLGSSEMLYLIVIWGKRIRFELDPQVCYFGINVTFVSTINLHPGLHLLWRCKHYNRFTNQKTLKTWPRKTTTWSRNFYNKIPLGSTSGALTPTMMLSRKTDFSQPPSLEVYNTRSKNNCDHTPIT